MKKSGFTLIELLVVIAILSLIMAIAFPRIGGVTDTIKEEMLSSKLDLIEEGAVMLGEDIRGSILSSMFTYKDFKCKQIFVKDLVPDYIDADNDNPCMINADDKVGCIVDPTGDDKYLDLVPVIIYIQNNRVKAVVNNDNSLRCIMEV